MPAPAQPPIRVEIARDTLLDLIRKIDPSILQSTELERLVHAAAKFAVELRQAGGSNELNEREAEYMRLTGAGSDFASALAAVTSALKEASESGWRIPTPPPPPVVNRIWGFIHYAYYDPNQAYDGDAAKRILGLLARGEEIPWSLTQAAADAQLALKRAPNAEAADAIRTWAREIQNLGTAELLHHVRGARLLCLCERAVLDGMAPTVESLVQRLISDWPACKEALHQAASYLLATDSRPVQSTGTPTTTQSPVSQAIAEPHPDIGLDNGFHKPTEEPPPRYSHGPLAGALLTDLASAICTALNLTADARNLRKSSLIWVRKLGSRSYEVFFTDRERYLDANARYEMLVKKSQENKQAKRGEKSQDKKDRK